MRNVPIEILLLEIAHGLQNIVKNPDLGDTITNFYQLSEGQKAKLAESEATIAKGDALLADLKSKAAAYSDINDRIAKAEALNSENDKKLKLIASKEDALAKVGSHYESVADSQRKEHERLLGIKAAHDDREKAIERKEREIEKTKSDLKKRVDKLKAETADL